METNEVIFKATSSQSSSGNSSGSVSGDSCRTLPQPLATRQAAFRNGAVVVNAGQPLNLVTVKAGSLKRYRHYQGQAFLCGIAATGETLGLSELFECSDSHDETLEAVGETTVLFHSAKDVALWMKSAPPFLLAALQSSAQTLATNRNTSRTRRPLELLPVRARVAATLWFLAERHGQTDANEPTVRVIDLDLTREEIAHLAGTVYESVIRTLTALKKEGVIDLQGRVIRILSETQLARVGHIAIGDANDQNAVSENRHSSNNGRPKEAS